MEDNYEQLLKVVSTVEGAAKPQEVNFIDTSGIGVEIASTQRPRYADMLKLIYGIESKMLAEMKQQAAHPQARAQQEVQVQQEKISIAQRIEPKMQMPRPNIRIGAAVSRGLKGMEEIAARREAAARELGAFAREELGAIESRVKTVRIKRINTRSLVLPNLSVSDQIVELERIAEGLKENVFDQDQLSVVRDEVLGLNQVVRESPQSQDALSQARDQRLKEVMSMFNG
ncbi:MAG: hypothetical protein KGH58_02600 [Candidatus Micrarchaeota archaeon]|nr:hypothetical protein [Candidatus Micrarchaeota archaeon]